MAKPAVLTIAHTAAAALGAQDKTREAAIVRAYGDAIKRLDSDINALTGRIERSRAVGEDLGIARMKRLDEMKVLMAHLETALTHAANQAVTVTQTSQLQAYTEALNTVEKQVQAISSAAPGSLPVPTFSRLPDQVVTDLAKNFSDTAPLTNLFNQITPGVATQVEHSMLVDVMTGKGTRQIAANIRSNVAMGGYRANLIARTETLRVYRSATQASYAQNSDVISSWQWQAALGGGCCALCWAMNGQVFPVSEGMDTHPGCRCAQVPVTKSYAEITGDPTLSDNVSMIPDGDTVMQDIPPAAARSILGPGRYQEWTNGTPLSSMVRLGDRGVWGKSWELIPLRELRGGNAG